MLRLCFLVFSLLMCNVCMSQTVFEIGKNNISFNSDAPHEMIKASSDKLVGIINTEKKQFAFKIEVASFKGFNSPLQKEHFNENYMESARYPDITFVGKIIEDVNLSVDGTYTVRAKGKLNAHGISRDRIINARVTVKNKKIDVASEFNVALADHDIKIPRIVNDKLATEVMVVMSATLSAK